MFKSLKKIKEYSRLGHSMNVISEMLKNIIDSYQAGQRANDLKEEIYVVSYITRKGILDRMEEFEWNMEGPILVPSISSKNITLFMAYSNTVIAIKNLSNELGLQSEVESILNKEEAYYEFENMFPEQVIDQLNKLILVN